MLRKSFPIMVSAGLACLMTGSYCLAQSTPTSSPTVSTGQDTAPRTPVMPFAFKLQLNPDNMAKIAGMMHSGHSTCFVQDLNPGDDASLIMICGLVTPTASFEP
jgi:hypothetical protein